jgi:hypothetical protein
MQIGRYAAGRYRADSPMNGLWILILAGLLVVGLHSWQRWRSLSLIRGWAGENGATVIAARRRGIRTGPFFWNSSRGQTVYRLTIRDRTGQTRQGWARCGGSSFGLIRSEVLVLLDGDEPVE